MKISEWSKDQFAEQTMNRLGIAADIKQIPLDAIDWEASAINHARVAGVDDSIVDSYAKAMGRGDVFPMIVARKVGNKYIIQGGNHRALAARQSGMKTIDAYVYVTDDEYIVDMAPRLLNPPTQGVSRNDLIQHACHAHFQYNIPFAELSETFCISQTSIRDYVNSIKTRLKLEQMGGSPVRNSVRLPSRSSKHWTTCSRPLLNWS